MIRDYFSPSQLESYCRCPEAYRRRYMEGEIIPPAIAMLKGSGFHIGAQVNMEQKVESHEDLPEAEIVEAAVEGFTTRLQDGYALTEEEESAGRDAVLGAAKDDVATMAGAHATLQAPLYQPTLVEERIRIAVPGARDLLGIIDLADDEDRVIDFKTSGKKKSQADADVSLQLTVYSAAYHAKTGREPEAVRLDSIVSTKSRTYRDYVDSSRGVDDYRALAHRISAIEGCLQAGNFPPATPGAWWCGEKWCGYWHTCPYVNSERKAKEFKV